MNDYPVVDGDLSEGQYQHFRRARALAVDSETTGLNPNRDRLCTVQISSGVTGDAVVVRIDRHARPERLIKILQDENILKIAHYARFEYGFFLAQLNCSMWPLFCTKVASRLARTYSNKHGLGDIVEDLLGIKLDKKLGSSDWGIAHLTTNQIEYAVADVHHLHAIKDVLRSMLLREGRFDLAQSAFNAIPALAGLDVEGFNPLEVLSH